MPRISYPVLLSRKLKVPEQELHRRGVFDATLNFDSKLFVDPLLLSQSAIHEALSGAQRVNKHFENLQLLLTRSTAEGDPCWRGAQRLMRYSEIAATCLGYGKSSTAGSAMGPATTARLLRTASEIIKLGVRDPELFLLLPFLEDGIGPDLVSDMTTNIILDDLLAFTQRIAGELSLPIDDHAIRGQQVRTLTNPLSKNPLLLVPADILRRLPIPGDWDGASSAARHNEEFRDRTNKYIGEILRNGAERDKTLVREQILSSKEAAETMLELIHHVPPNSYDAATDPRAMRSFSKGVDAAKKDNTPIIKPGTTIEAVWTVVRTIVSRFQHLVENQGLWQLLWDGDRNRNEKSAQMLFFGIACGYCEANNLDITPEADTGRGPVDFKVSTGFTQRLLVELKLSNNTRLVHGYDTQLQLYKKAERTAHALFLIIDIGGLGKKHEGLLKMKNEAVAKGELASEIVVVDATRKVSASHATDG